MKKIKILSVLAFCLMAFAATASKPNVYIIATGGTIAGTGASATGSAYTSGQVTVHALIEAVPQLEDVANITGEQFVNIGSQDMNDAVWLGLAKRVNDLLQQDDVDGIVITHGTDTMEETAYFLDLTVKSDKPVVLTGAMRPSTALSADGPLNLYNAVVTAADPASKGKGVMLVMNGLILAAEGAEKTNTIDVQTFQAPNGGNLGYVYNSKPYYTMSILRKHTVQSEFDASGLERLPKVGIVYSFSNAEPEVLDYYLNNGYDGIVIAGVGNGNFPKSFLPKIQEMRKKGMLVVRSSRIDSGPTTLYDEVNDTKYELVASWLLNPQKSRVLLMLALTKTRDWRQIQSFFEEY